VTPSRAGDFVIEVNADRREMERVKGIEPSS
jgi:hypothetical protein